VGRTTAAKAMTSAVEDRLTATHLRAVHGVCEVCGVRAGVRDVPDLVRGRGRAQVDGSVVKQTRTWAREVQRAEEGAAHLRFTVVFHGQFHSPSKRYT